MKYSGLQIIAGIEGIEKRAQSHMKIGATLDQLTRANKVLSQDNRAVKRLALPLGPAAVHSGTSLGVGNLSGRVFNGTGLGNYIANPAKAISNTMLRVKGDADTIKLVGRTIRDQLNGAIPPLKNVLSNPQSRKALNVIGSLHEFSELSVPLRVAQMGGFTGGHLSPSVILREHNTLRRLTGMPTEARRNVKDVFRRLRALDGSSDAIADLGIRGYRHGSSPRFSRHAIRRIVDLWKAKAAGGKTT